jgi:hypothetical protein
MNSLNIEAQAAIAITVGLMGWIIGAAVWEWASTNLERWLGRIAVASGILQLAAFSHHASRQVERLNVLVDTQGQKAHDGREPNATEFTGRDGRKFRIEFTNDGRSTTGIGYTTTLLPAMGRPGRSERQGGGCDCLGRGLHASTDGMSCERSASTLATASASPRRRVCECGGIESCDCIDCRCCDSFAAVSARAN